MGIFGDFITFAVGVVVIIKSADFFTDGAEGLAKALKIPRIIIGLTIVSVATTFPEFIVSTISSYLGAGGIAVGNAVGSCLANIGLILGLAAMMRTIEFDPRLTKLELPFLAAVVLLLFFLVFDGTLTAFDGVFLLSILALFFAYIVMRERKTKKSPERTAEERVSIKRYVFFFLIGAVGVVLSARYAIIPSGMHIARFFGVPEIVIGLTMVAVGTSLPELFTAVIASTKKMGELAAGNVIGANILNILWVLGFSSVINPLAIDRQTKFVALPVVFALTILLLLFSRTQSRLTRKEGLALFLLYGCYLLFIFMIAYK